jgi:hypothetical protein
MEISSPRKTIVDRRRSNHSSYICIHVLVLTFASIYLLLELETGTPKTHKGLWDIVKSKITNTCIHINASVREEMMLVLTQ